MRRLAPVALLVGVLALTGCRGGSPEPPPTPAGIDPGAFDPADGNGLWLLSGDAVTEQVVAAMRAGGPVSLTGGFTELTEGTETADPAPGRALTVDYAGSAGRLRASVTAGELRLDVVVADGRAYLRGNEAYAAHTGHDDFARGWVCTTPDDGLLEEWAPLLSPAELVDGLLGGNESIAANPPAGDAETLDVVVGASSAPTGRLAVERFGAPLPRDFFAGDATGDGEFAFRGWGEPVDVAAPEELVRDCGD